MKRPIYNLEERWEIRELDCTMSAVRKLNIAVLGFLREIERSFIGLMKITNPHKQKA